MSTTWLGLYEQNKRGDLLEKQTTSQHERDTAQWIKLEDGLIFKNRAYKCSYCDNSLDFNGVNAGRGNVNYCPNCGRKMIGRTC